MIDTQTLRPGDITKADPYVIAFIANPALETPSGSFIPDPITSDKLGFDAAVLYAIDCIFGLLPGQAENFISDPVIGPKIRVISIREGGLPAEIQNALVFESVFGSLLEPRRDRFIPYLSRHDIRADVAFAVSKSARFSRSAAYGTTDDTARAGTPFQLDGATRKHWHFPSILGTVALHVTARMLTPAHEFGHASSSYDSGFITDLYTPNSAVQFNVRIGRPILPNFANYEGVQYLTDPVRDGLGYPPAWTSFHPELVVKSAPAVMDDYTGQPNPLVCRHDAITVAYLRDRLVAKIGR